MARGGMVPRMSIDTALAAGMSNPGLGVMGLQQSMGNGEMQMAINTPLPPSPAIGPHGGHQSGTTTPYMDASPFLSANQSFAGQQHSFFGPMATHSPTMHQVNGAGPTFMMQNGAGGADDHTMLGPNAKAMRTPLKRTASNSHQFALEAATAAANQQKRKSPGI